MLLNAYYKMLFYEASMHSRYSSTITIPSIKTCDGAIQTNLCGGYYGTDYAGIRKMFAQPTQSILSQTSKVSNQASPGIVPYSNLIIGSGTTAVTADDYKVEEEITADVSCLSVSTTYNMTEGTIKFVKVIQNNSETETLTVTEVGLSVVFHNNSTNGVNCPQILVYREILETPIVVAPGEDFAVSITHKFPMPTW